MNRSHYFLRLLGLCAIWELSVINLVLLYGFTDEIGFEKLTSVYSDCF